MGLKWFRANLSMEEGQTPKVLTMTGSYRRVSYSNFDTSAMLRDKYTASTVSSSFANTMTADVDNEKMQCDYKKAGLTSQALPSSTTDSQKQQESSTSIKDSEIEKQSSAYEEETNKISEDKTDIPDTKKRISQNNEIVI